MSKEVIKKDKAEAIKVGDIFTEKARQYKVIEIRKSGAYIVLDMTENRQYIIPDSLFRLGYRKVEELSTREPVFDKIVKKINKTMEKLDIAYGKEEGEFYVGFVEGYNTGLKDAIKDVREIEGLAKLSEKGK